MRISDWSSDVCPSDLAGSDGGGCIITLPFDNLDPHGQPLVVDRHAIILPFARRRPIVGMLVIGVAADLVRGALIHALRFHAVEQRLGLGIAKRAFVAEQDRKSTRLNSSHYCASRMPSSA